MATENRTVAGRNPGRDAAAAAFTNASTRALLEGIARSHEIDDADRTV